METKTKYIKFEQDAVIILDAIDDREIPVKGLKFCGFCTLPDKRPVYHYSPSAPAKPEPAKSDCVCRNKVGTLNHLVSDTGGGFTIISMGKIGDEDIKCDSCGAVIRKSELEVRGSQKLCTDCAVVHDIDGENVEGSWSE